MLSGAKEKKQQQKKDKAIDFQREAEVCLEEGWKGTFWVAGTAL